MSIANQIKAAAKRFYEPLMTGDVGALDAVMAEGWQGVPALRTGPGRDGWKASIKHLRSVFSDIDVSIETVLASEDLVAVRSVTSGTHTGELLGVQGTGNRVQFRAADFHRIEDGKIVESWHLEDYFGIATQLGLTFTPAS
jgi:predicted ester cyclase